VNKVDNNDWLKSEYGQSFLYAESEHIKQALRHFSGPNVLQLGNVVDNDSILALDFPQLITVQSSLDEGNNSAQEEITQVVADAAFLPFSPDSFSSVILPHVLESNSLPHQVLREAHRVLRPEGRVLLTGFNPISLIGLQRQLFSKSSFAGQYYSINRVKDWLKLLGFDVVGSAIFQYAPLCKSQSLRNTLAFINSIGDRWLPMTGGGYMISAKKRDAGMRLIGKLKYPSTKKRRQKLATAVSTDRRQNK